MNESARLSNANRRLRHREKLFRRTIWFLLLLLIAMSFVWAATAGAQVSYPINDAGLAEMRLCESTNDYTAATNFRVSKNSYGAYQFEMPTWVETIDVMHAENYLGYDWSQWRSVFPHRAPPAIQDHAAAWLYSRVGPRPWSFVNGVYTPGAGCGGRTERAVAASGGGLTLADLGPVVVPVPGFAG